VLMQQWSARVNSWQAMRSFERSRQRPFLIRLLSIDITHVIN
jgi:hypothetical protein